MSDTKGFHEGKTVMLREQLNCHKKWKIFHSEMYLHGEPQENGVGWQHSWNDVLPNKVAELWEKFIIHRPDARLHEFLPQANHTANGT